MTHSQRKLAAVAISVGAMFGSVVGAVGATSVAAVAEDVGGLLGGGGGGSPIAGYVGGLLGGGGGGSAGS